MNVLQLSHLLQPLHSGDLLFALGAVYLLRGLFVAARRALFLFLFFHSLRLLVLFAIVLFPRLIVIFLFALFAHGLSLVNNIKVGTDKVIDRKLVNIFLWLALLFFSVFICVFKHYDVIGVGLVLGLEAFT